MSIVWGKDKAFVFFWPTCYLPLQLFLHIKSSTLRSKTLSPTEPLHSTNSYGAVKGMRILLAELAKNLGFAHARCPIQQQCWRAVMTRAGEKLATASALG